MNNLINDYKMNNLINDYYLSQFEREILPSSDAVKNLS